MSPKRGRRPKDDKGKKIAEIVKHKDIIVKANNKIISKLDPIWQKIADNLGGGSSAFSIYTFVACNRGRIKDILFKDTVHDENVTIDTSQDASRNDSVNDSLHNSSQELNSREFTVPIPREEFTSLIVDRMYKRTVRGRVQTRKWRVLESGKWEALVTDKIWQQTRQKCGFNFKNLYIANDDRSGSITGTCKCGNKLRARFEDFGGDDIILHCTVTPDLNNNEKCGKVYLRQPIRRKIAEELCTKSVEVARAEIADQLMKPGDPEPPHLPRARTMHTAKSQLIAERYLDKDPIKAVCMMKTDLYPNSIHNIGYDPFYVHYWTNHQIHVYKTYAAMRSSCVCIDATGSIVRKVGKASGAVTKHIFLYICVVNCDGTQCTVSHMLSESQNTNSIQYWLMEWVRSGCPYPKEVVTDSSRALLTAVIKTFTGYSTIEEYANSCNETTVPNCYVRIDVAHFLKRYASYVKELRRNIKTLYLASIGLLIRSTNLKESRCIFYDILNVSLSETDGNLPNGQPSRCELSRKRLTKLITGSSAESDAETIIQDADDLEPAAEQEEIIEENSWSRWAHAVEKEVKDATVQLGDHDNAHYFPALATHLIEDMRHLPLWYCVCRDQFDYGRIPASSAPVEGEFNKIKNTIFGGKVGLRPDEFLQKHLDYLSGKLKVVDVALNEIACQKSNESMASEKVSKVAASRISRDVDITQQSISTSSIRNCPACTRNDMPSGAHKCVSCRRFVHALEYCSYPIEPAEEGYGQLRICGTCYVRKQPATTVPIVDLRNESCGQSSNVSGTQPPTTQRPTEQTQSNIDKDLLNQNNGGNLGTLMDDLNETQSTENERSKTMLPESTICKTTVANRRKCASCGDNEDQENSSDDKAKEMLIEPYICSSCWVGSSQAILHENESTVDIVQGDVPRNKEQCPACANNDEPSGAHKCVRCDRRVHVLDQCSRPVNKAEEGFGEARICNNCYMDDSVVPAEVTATREIEDWRGLTSQKSRKSKNKQTSKRRAMYLGENKQKIRDALLWEKHSSVPILKNGSSIKLQAVQIKQKKYTLTNTCAFDTCYQILLAGAVDHTILQKESSRNENQLYSFVIDTLEKNVGAPTYRKRVEILKDVPIEDSAGESRITEDVFGNVLINCNVNIGYLATHIFKKTPSFCEKFQCDKGCKTKIFELPVASVSNDVLIADDFSTAIKDAIFMSENTPCLIQGCDGNAYCTERNIGNIIIIDVYSIQVEPFRMQLQDVPKKINLSPKDESPKSDAEKKTSEWDIIGIAHYRGPAARTRHTDEQSGHYSAIVLRKGGQWLEYDDQQAKEKKKCGVDYVTPSLIVYGKI